MPQLDRRCPEEMVRGSTPDISEYAMFSWYELVWYYEPKAKFPEEKKILGQWIGVAKVTTDILAYYILTKLGKVLIRKAIWAVLDDEQKTASYQYDLKQLDDAIRSKVGDSLAENQVDPGLIGDFPQPPEDLFEEDEEAVEPADGETRADVLDDLTPEAYDEYLTA